MDQYRRINLKQHFVKQDIIEHQYLTEVADSIVTFYRTIPNKLRHLIPNKLIKKNQKFLILEKHEISHHRLLPKVLKLKTISKDSIKDL